MTLDLVVHRSLTRGRLALLVYHTMLPFSCCPPLNTVVFRAPCPIDQYNRLFVSKSV